MSSVDVKSLKTYQQVYIYLIPILGNLGFINIIVIVFRVRWFEKRFKEVGERPSSPSVQHLYRELTRLSASSTASFKATGSRTRRRGALEAQREFK
jgi:hypothetical protein